MKKIIMFLTVLLSIFSISCAANSTSTRAVEEGKIALVSKEYDKAKDLFTLAINEDSKNTDAKDFLDLTSNYIDLLAAIENSEFDKANDLIAKIESNDKLNIIKDNFDETKNNVSEKKETFDKHITEVEAIEKLLNESKVDDVKSQATTKLNEVKGIRVLEDRLNNVIAKVDEVIANAKAKILKYYDGNYDIEYNDMQLFNNNNVMELNGKAVLIFMETGENSHIEYIYRMEDGEVFILDQDLYFWVSNNNKLIYMPKETQESLAQLEKLKEEQENKTQSQIKISPQKSMEIALNYFLKKRPDVSESEVIVAQGDEVDENNEYYRGICYKGGNSKVVAEYYVNATTGELRVLWD